MWICTRSKTYFECFQIRLKDVLWGVVKISENQILIEVVRGMRRDKEKNKCSIVDCR